MKKYFCSYYGIRDGKDHRSIMKSIVDIGLTDNSNENYTVIEDIVRQSCFSPTGTIEDIPSSSSEGEYYCYFPF